MSKSEYTNVLKKKIILQPPPIPPSKAITFLLPDTLEEYRKNLEFYSQEQQAVLRQNQIEKIPALYEHFGIDINSKDAKEWLIICLAEKHVPGFQYEVKNDAGRPRIWDDITLLELFFDVEKILAKKNPRGIDKLKFTIEQACKTLIKEEPWKSMVKAKMAVSEKGKILQNKYAASKNTKLVKMYIENRGQDNTQELFVNAVVEKIFSKNQK